MHFPGGLRGASIIDSLDTLYIMDLMDEYNEAKEWVKTSLDLNSVRVFQVWQFFIFWSFTFHALTTLKFHFKLIGIPDINIMKFSAVALRAGLILNSAIVF